MQGWPEHIRDVGIVWRNVAARAQLAVNRLAEGGQRIVNGLTEGRARYGGVVRGQAMTGTIALPTPAPSSA